MKIESSGSGGVYSITKRSEVWPEVGVKRVDHRSFVFGPRTSALDPERSVATLRANIAA